jgi:hypothetical protein
MTDQTCAMNASGKACVTCCQGVHQTGIQALVMFVQGCVCGNSGVCQSECASEYCMNGNGTPGDACDVCIQGSIVTADGGMGACYPAVANGCSGDAQCSAYVACTGGCPDTP